jgi:hypothetical protein
VEPQSFFARTRPVPHPERFAVVAVRPSERELALRIIASTPGFSAVLCQANEVTLVLPQERWNQVQPVFMDAAVSTDFRVVTLESDVELDAVGYISALTGALARADLPVAVLSGYSGDHLLVRDRDLARCLDVLQKAGAAAPGRAP